MTNAKIKKVRRFTGVVVSDKMQKTVIVSVVRIAVHEKYQKRYKVTRRFKAHDENGVYKIGDTVVIEETKPISKDKRWIVVGKA